MLHRPLFILATALLAVGQGTGATGPKPSNRLGSMAPGMQDMSSARSRAPLVTQTDRFSRSAQASPAAGHAASGSLQRLGEKVAGLYKEQREKRGSVQCPRIFKHLDRALAANNLARLKQLLHAAQLKECPLHSVPIAAVRSRQAMEALLLVDSTIVAATHTEIRPYLERPAWL